MCLIAKKKRYDSILHTIRLTDKLDSFCTVTADISVQSGCYRHFGTRLACASFSILQLSRSPLSRVHTITGTCNPSGAYLQPNKDTRAGYIYNRKFDLNYLPLKGAVTTMCDIFQKIPRHFWV